MKTKVTTVPVACDHCGRDLTLTTTTAEDGQRRTHDFTCPEHGLLFTEALERRPLTVITCPGGEAHTLRAWVPASRLRSV
jgi:hypothetical protein